MENKVAEEQVTQPSDQLSLRCPRCNKEVSEGYLTVADDVLKEYTRCLLGQRPFSKTMDLFGGVMRVTFEAMSAEQAELFQTIVSEDTDLARILDIKMLATLKSISMVDSNMSATTDVYLADYNTRKEYCRNAPTDVTAIIKNIDAAVLGTLRRCALAFDTLCVAIKDSVFSEDFYTGIGLL